MLLMQSDLGQRIERSVVVLCPLRNTFLACRSHAMLRLFGLTQRACACLSKEFHSDVDHRSMQVSEAMISAMLAGGYIKRVHNLAIPIPKACMLACHRFSHLLA